MDIWWSINTAGSLGFLVYMMLYVGLYPRGDTTIEDFTEEHFYKTLFAGVWAIAIVVSEVLWIGVLGVSKWG